MFHCTAGPGRSSIGPEFYSKERTRVHFIKTLGGRIKKGFHGDCVVRSISIATGRQYVDVFEDLMALGLEMGAYPNHDPVWKKYLKQLGWEANKPPRDPSGKLIKLVNWADAPELAVIKNSRHLTCVVDNTVYDIFDTRYRPVNTYWTPVSGEVR